MALRQLRATVIGTAALVGAVVAALLVHGILARRVAGRMIATCSAGDGATCTALRSELTAMRADVLPYLGSLSVTPVLVAAVWGAPLISREIETGTAALAWCQSVTRRRWFAVRLAVCTAALTVLGAALGFTVTWWLESFSVVSPSGTNPLRILTVHGPLLPALWVAALLIGVLVGIVARRLVPASGVTAALTFIAMLVFNATGGSVPQYAESDLRVLMDLTVQALAVSAGAAALAVLSFRRLARVRV